MRFDSVKMTRSSNLISRTSRSILVLTFLTNSIFFRQVQIDTSMEKCHLAVIILKIFNLPSLNEISPVVTRKSSFASATSALETCNYSDKTWLERNRLRGSPLVERLPANSWPLRLLVRVPPPQVESRNLTATGPVRWHCARSAATKSRPSC